MKNIYVKLALFLFLATAFVGCSKSGDNNSNPVPPANTGNFTSNTTTYTGTCVSIPDVGTGGAIGNIDVSITTTSGVAFFVYNMPQQSSGTYSFNNGDKVVGGSALYGIFLSPSATTYTTINGSVAKTGANSFTFSCTVYDIVSNTSLSVTGKGSY